MNWNSDAEVKEAQVVLEQYKAYIGDLTAFGARYSAVHTLYFTLLGATVAVLGLSESGEALGGPWSVYVLWIVAAFGVGLCVLWLGTTNYYRASFAAKFKVLREMETRLPVQPYTLETRYLGLPVEAGEAPARPHVLIAIERLIPVVFIVLIVALAALGGR